MAKPKNDLLKASPWSGLIMGNHALARGMIEAGVRVATTYPGSPTPEIAAALEAIPKDRRPYYFEYSTNEKVALEVAAGASLNGHLSTVFFKSVGLNVASDSLIQLCLMELIGGMVIVLGDDPGANSSQNEQDNRHFARSSYIPMMEPATPTEAYQMYLEAARISRKMRAPIFIRMTTHVCHAKEVVRFGSYEAGEIDWTPRFSAKNGPYVPITTTVFPKKRAALEKLEEFRKISEEFGFNRVVRRNRAGRGLSEIGVISAALPALSILENLSEAEADMDLLILGMTYPLPRKMIADFLDSHRQVLIVEELDRVIETEIKAFAWETKSECRILARDDIEELMGELTPDRTWTLLGKHWPKPFPSKNGAFEPKSLTPRLAQMCPGCGHRSAFHSVRRAIEKETITVADIGCHSMGFMPPYNMGEVLFSMGHSTGTGSGLSIRNKTRKVVSFMGDSTLFHAGLPGVVNAVVNKHDLTLIVLENGTTAMTGHQPRPGSGEVGEKIPLPAMFEALGVKFVRDVDTYDQPKLIQAIRDAMSFDGFAVVIARHPCMLKFIRQQRAKIPGFKIGHVGIDQDICNLSKVCVADFACPSFFVHEDGKVTVHPDLCIGDGSCLQTCPKKAIVRQKDGGVS